MCVTVTAKYPIEAIRRAVRCYTTANYPDDEPLHEVACTEDNAWSVFESPIGGRGEVSAVYHNRSHNRDRKVKIEVDYSEPQNEGSEHPNVLGVWKSQDNHAFYKFRQEGNILVCNCLSFPICGPAARGNFRSRFTFVMHWPDNTWVGTISSDGKRIDWNNHTVWLRTATDDWGRPQ